MADFSCMHARCRVGLPLFNMMKKTLLPTAVACFLGAVSQIAGASGQAVQNMNLMFGLDETSGLRLKPSAF